MREIEKIPLGSYPSAEEALRNLDENCRREAQERQGVELKAFLKTQQQNHFEVKLIHERYLRDKMARNENHQQPATSLVSAQKAVSLAVKEKFPSTPIKRTGTKRTSANNFDKLYPQLAQCQHPLSQQQLYPISFPLPPTPTNQQLSQQYHINNNNMANNSAMTAALYYQQHHFQQQQQQPMGSSMRNPPLPAAYLQLQRASAMEYPLQSTVKMENSTKAGTPSAIPMDPWHAKFPYNGAGAGGFVPQPYPFATPSSSSLNTQPHQHQFPFPISHQQPPASAVHIQGAQNGWCMTTTSNQYSHQYPLTSYPVPVRQNDYPPPRYTTQNQYDIGPSSGGRAVPGQGQSPSDSNSAPSSTHSTVEGAVNGDNKTIAPAQPMQAWGSRPNIGVPVESSYYMGGVSEEIPRNEMNVYLGPCSLPDLPTDPMSCVSSTPYYTFDQLQ